MVNVSGSGPVVLRILLGSELRRLRETAEITPQAAAREIHASESKISRMERGRTAFKEEDVAELLYLYGVTDDEMRDELLSLTRRANQPGWWHGYNDILPTWFQSYVGLEQAANRIRTHEAHYIPGLLQTEDYAAAVISLDDFPPEEVERRVALRVARQRRFFDSSLRLWAIIDEAALRRRFGGSDVMRGQLEHLIDVSKMTNLTLQATPLRNGGHTSLTGFSILRFADSQMADVVYVEQLTSAHYLDKREDVDAYIVGMERLSMLSATPRESVKFISDILDDL